MSLHYIIDNSYLLVNGKKIVEFKADNKNVNFPTQICLRSISNGFSTTESREENVYEFSVDYSSIDKFDIVNIHKYLMIKNDIYSSVLSNKRLLYC